MFGRIVLIARILVLERCSQYGFLNAVLFAMTFTRYWKVGPDHQTTIDSLCTHPAVICAMLIEVFVLFPREILF